MTRGKSDHYGRVQILQPSSCRLDSCSIHPNPIPRCTPVRIRSWAWVPASLWSIPCVHSYIFEGRFRAEGGLVGRPVSPPIPPGPEPFSPPNTMVVSVWSWDAPERLCRIGRITPRVLLGHCCPERYTHHPVEVCWVLYDLRIIWLGAPDWSDYSLYYAIVTRIDARTTQFMSPVVLW